MMQEVVRALETGWLAQVGLIAFVVAFILVIVRVFSMSRKSRDAAKQLPLEDDE